jgi:hypothetical protein
LKRRSEVELDARAEGLDPLREELSIRGVAIVIPDEKVDSVTRFSDRIERCTSDEGSIGLPIALLPEP